MSVKGVPLGSGTRCTIQRHNGDFCDAPGAEDMPFPICTRHALELYRRVREMIEGATATDGRALAAGNRMVAGMVAERRAREAVAADHDVVYYVKVGDLIKIGYTSDLRSRIRNYPPGRRLLATEQGSKPLEQQRLREFASLRVHGNEWHRIDAPLMVHINKLRRADGLKALSLT